MEFIKEEIARAEEALASRILHPAFDRATYLRMEYYIEFQETLDLKMIWCYQAASRWKVDPKELYKRASVRCPIFNTLLDYGLGFNTVLREAAGRGNDWFRPTVDHIKSKSKYPELQHDVTNMIVISSRANTLKNDLESEAELDAFYSGIKRVYFSN